MIDIEELKRDMASMSRDELEMHIINMHQLDEGREKLLAAIPQCPAHGPCVPHALKWIDEQKDAAQYVRGLEDALQHVVELWDGPDCGPQVFVWNLDIDRIKSALTPKDITP